MRIRILMLLFPALAALMATGTVQARGGQAKVVPPAVAVTDPVGPKPATLPDSVRRVERQTGGEVLRAEPMQQDGHEIYRLKVLTRDGRVRVMQTDPNQPANDPPTDSRKRKPEASNQEGNESGG